MKWRFGRKPDCRAFLGVRRVLRRYSQPCPQDRTPGQKERQGVFALSEDRHDIVGGEFFVQYDFHA
jgi:hypothetical protein